MTASKVVTHIHDVHIASQLLESISEDSNTAYYTFLGAHVAEANTDKIIADSVQDIHKDAYRNMIQGKRIMSGDASLMIRNVPYVSNKFFSMYDDQDIALTTSDYFCVVNAASFYHIYKCLDNNRGSNSTVEPDFSHISGANTQVYQTSDGYRWKYMYTVSSQAKQIFATTNFFPVTSNTIVESSATDGVLDIIKVDGTGEGYDNYINGTFGVGDLRVNGNTLLYAISNSTASTANGFYTGCLAYISSGTGVGGHGTITDYFSNPNGHFFVIDAPFDINPEISSAFEITPEVVVVGSGIQTVNVVARALVNSVGSNSIYRVEVLDRGADYDYFVANAVANAIVGVSSNAELRPIYAPFGGHGANASSELSSSRLSFSHEFSNSESNTILTTNVFRHIGILKDPLFANVCLDFSSANGTFQVGETAHKINPVRINTNATINTTSTIVDCASGDFANQVVIGDFLYFKSGSGTSHQVGTVNNVTNSTQIVLVANCRFACTETLIYQANASANGIVREVNTATEICLSNVAGTITVSDMVIGSNSGGRGIVNFVARNSVTKDFATFIQLYKYECTLDSGAFQENEVVYQTSLATSNAFLHSAIVDGGSVTIYTSNQVGTFAVSGSIVGNTSGASATVTTRYEPELVFGSGEIMYIEDIENPVTRQTDQSEAINTIFEF